MQLASGLRTGTGANATKGEKEQSQDKRELSVNSVSLRLYFHCKTLMAVFFC